MEPVIETKGLKHVYIDSDNNPVTALDGIDLQIMPGEFVAVIGANGSGKSTLARHFNALLLPSEGSVNVHGLDTLDENNLWQIRQDTGMVFQNPDNQIVAAVVEEDVAFGPENIGVPTEELKQRVEDAFRIFCPAARSNGWLSPARWRWGPAASYWTNPLPCWTRKAARKSSVPCGN